MNYKSKVYPNGKGNTTIENSDNKKSNFGLCFSGGGNRALTCAWGQLLGLETLGVMDKVRYLSSVSGGTWATSIYNFMTKEFTDQELLGKYFSPENLSTENKSGKLNVTNLDKNCIGNVPNSMFIDDLLVSTLHFLIVNRNEESNFKWLWAYLINKYVLKPYNIGSDDKSENDWSSSKSFTLSEEYAKSNFPDESPSLDSLHFLRTGRPFHIMNNNIMDYVESNANIIQLPNQVTPIAGGAKGKTPDNKIEGDGLVETYGVCSTLNQTSGKDSPVSVEVNQQYSLIDIVSTSSAFFAEALAGFLRKKLDDTGSKKSLVTKVVDTLKKNEKESILSEIKDDFTGIKDAIENYFLDKILKNLEKIVPEYNYWSVTENSKNEPLNYTDGGSLENTGILGLIAQTDTGEKNQEPLTIVAFVNGDTPIEKKGESIIAGAQAAALFGLDFNTDTGSCEKFSESQSDYGSGGFRAESLIKIFNNSADSNGNTPFEILRNQLYASSCGASPDQTPDDTKVTTEPSFCQIELKTVDNSLANITGGRKIKLLYIENAKMLNWQNSLTDEKLKSDIAKGQEDTGSLTSDLDVLKKEFHQKQYYQLYETLKNKDLGLFSNFPYFSTFFKIGLHPEESHALSQMWAWAVADDRSPLKQALLNFVKENTSVEEPAASMV